MNGSKNKLSAAFLVLALPLSGCIFQDEDTLEEAKVDVVETPEDQNYEGTQTSRVQTWQKMRRAFECEDPNNAPMGKRDRELAEIYGYKKMKDRVYLYDMEPHIEDLLRHQGKFMNSLQFFPQGDANDDSRYKISDTKRQHALAFAHKYQDNPNVMYHIVGSSTVDNAERFPSEYSDDEYVDAVLVNFRLRWARAAALMEVFQELDISAERICITTQAHDNATPTVRYWANDYTNVLDDPTLLDPPAPEPE